MPIFVDIQFCVKFSPNETYSKRDQRRLQERQITQNSYLLLSKSESGSSNPQQFSS